MISKLFKKQKLHNVKKKEKKTTKTKKKQNDELMVCDILSFVKKQKKKSF